MAEDNLYDKLSKSLSDFKKALDKEASEVHRCKQEIAALKMHINTDINSGQFMRDPTRIVISAPEIIIGNVDFSGRLLGSGTVLVKGSSLDLQASGETGRICSRATNIVSEAVDPGIDGTEAIVYSSSSITGKARSIGFSSECTSGAFVYPAFVGGAGIRFDSDTSISLDASCGSESLSKNLDSRKSAADKLASKLDSAASDQQKYFEKLIKDIQTLVGKRNAFSAEVMDIRSNMCDISDNIDETKRVLTALYSAVDAYAMTLSRIAEAKRQSKAFNDAKTAVSKKKSDYKKKNTGCGVIISAENLDYMCEDGDHNIRETEDSGLRINSMNLKISSHKADGSLIDKSGLAVNTQNVLISTSDNKVKDQKNSDNPAVGAFRLVSKNIGIEAVDYEKKDDKVQEKALTAKGSVSVRAENFVVSATDTEGKATGKASLNAKKIELKSMDVDKEKRTDKQLAAGSTSLLVSEKIYQGASDSKNKSKQVQISSEQVGVFAKTTAEIQQDKAVLQLSGGDASISGGNTGIFGTTTVNAAATFKAEIKAPKASIDNVEAKSSFKSPNISDGMALGGGGGGGSLSAKLKEEDAPKDAQ